MACLIKICFLRVGATFESADAAIAACKEYYDKNLSPLGKGLHKNKCLMVTPLRTVYPSPSRSQWFIFFVNFACGGKQTRLRFDKVVLRGLSGSTNKKICGMTAPLRPTQS